MVNKKLPERNRGDINVPARHSVRGPVDAVIGGRPNSDELAAIGEPGEAPVSNEAWMRRVYALNEYLAEDMGEDVTIKIGCEIVSVFFDPRSNVRTGR